MKQTTIQIVWMIGVFVGLLVFLAFYSDYKFYILSSIKRFVNKEGFDTESGSGPEFQPGGTEETSRLSPGTAFAVETEKLVVGERLTPFSEPEAVANWDRMTSEKCYRVDMGESLKKVGNYLQRTNNYQRSHPDDCSAPNHEFVGTFYKPHEGVGATPKTGLPLPASTQCA